MRRALALALVAAGLGLLAAAGRATAQPVPPPSLAAPAWILVDGASGKILAAHRPDAERPIASTTKVMTVLLALERLPLARVLTAPPYAAGAAESKIGLTTGERMRVADLIRAALLPSANDAAHALAIGAAGSQAAFVALMNTRARRLGLAHTHFTTPVGLDEPGNYSSARDLAVLARALRTRPFARETMARGRARLASGGHPRVVLNRNDLVGRVRGVDGVKTGHTNGAGYVLVGSADRPGLGLVSVVLGAPSESARDSDTLALLRWGFANWRVRRLLRPGQVLAERRSTHGARPVSLVAARGIRRLVRRGQASSVTVRAPRTLDGPLPAHAVVGSATVRAGGRVVGRVDLLTAARVPGAGVVRALAVPVMVVLAVALLAAIALVTRRRLGVRA